MRFEPQWMTTTTCGDHPLMMAITKGPYAGTIRPLSVDGSESVGIGNEEDIMNPTLL